MTTVPMDSILKDLMESTKTLHARSDRFMDWAEELHSEFRTMQKELQELKNRILFIETQCLHLAEFMPANEEVIMKRLENIKQSR
jgi:hypothetical protein